MKTNRSSEVLLKKLLIFICLSFYSFRSHAQPTYFTKVFTGPAQITSLAFGNNTFVGTGGGFWYVSHDGANWTVFQTSPIINQGGLAYGNGMFLAFGTNYQNHANYVLQSTNGTAWTILFTSAQTLTAGAYNCISNTWVLVGPNEIATATVTSSNWNWSEFQPSFSPECIAYGNGYFVIGAYFSILETSFDQYNYSVYSSVDGNNWQYDTTLSTYASYAYYTTETYGIAYGNGVFVATVPGGNNYSGPRASQYSSTNLVDWTLGQYVNLTGYQFNSPIAFGGNEFFMELMPTIFFTSPDGYGWYRFLGAQPTSFNALAYGQGTFVGADYGVDIYQSDVFNTNTNPPSATLGISTFPGVTIFGTAGSVYQVQASTDLTNWQSLTNIYLPHSPLLWFDTISPFGSQNFYRTIQLQ